MNIGNKIKALRYKSSITQEQLAQRLGVSAQAVSKWENAVAMPDISLLPDIAEVFGISIDDLFDLTSNQRFNRIESRMEFEEELDADVFREYEAFLKEQIDGGKEKLRAVSLLAHLYHHHAEACLAKADRFAREAILMAPDEKDCQWILQKAENDAVWDWNMANHSKTIDFYKEAAEKGTSARPYYFLLDNLIADHRVNEAKAALEEVKKLPHKPFMIPVYEAAIALAEYNEEAADAVIEKALGDFHDDPGMLFEAAQYFARKCEYEKAIKYYEDSFAAEEDCKPRFTDALYGIAMIYEIKGDNEKAADTMRRVLDVMKNEWGFTEEFAISETEREIERLMKKK